MTTTGTRAQIEQALDRLGAEVPALRSLKLVLRLELRARGDVPVWRVQLPEREISRDPAGDARVDVSLPHSHLNELAAKGGLRDWVEAYEHGHLRVSGDPAVMRLVGAVLERQLGRGR